MSNVAVDREKEIAAKLRGDKVLGRKLGVDLNGLDGLVNLGGDGYADDYEEGDEVAALRRKKLASMKGKDGFGTGKGVGASAASMMGGLTPIGSAIGGAGLPTTADGYVDEQGAREKEEGGGENEEENNDQENSDPLAQKRELDLKKKESAKEGEDSAEAKIKAAAAKQPNAFYMATARLLRWSWWSIIPTFGLSLIYTNLHAFLGITVGHTFFCELGYEWCPPGVSREVWEKKAAMIKIPEVCFLALLDALLAAFASTFIMGIFIMFDLITIIKEGVKSFFHIN